SPDRVLAELDELGSPATVASAGRRYFGFVTGGSLPVTVAASWLASAWDQNAGLVACSPIGAKLEQVALDRLKDLFHLTTDSGGGFVTSATAANFSALAAARHALLADRKSTRLNSSHSQISYAVFCLKKKKNMK